MALHNVRIQSGRSGKVAAISAPNEAVPYLAPLAADLRAEGLPPEAVKAGVNKFVALTKGAEAELQRITEKYNAIEADAEAEFQKAEEAYNRDSTFANAQLLELAKSARTRVKVDCNRQRKIAAGAVARAKERELREAERVEDLALLRSVVEEVSP